MKMYHPVNTHKLSFLFVFLKMKTLDSNMEKMFITRKPTSRVFYLEKISQRFFFLLRKY